MFKLVIRRLGALCLLLAMAGCIGDDKTEYPDLKREDLIGCWSEINPANFKCWEDCFDSAGLFFHKVVHDSGLQMFSEGLGTYVLKGNSVGVTYDFVDSRDTSLKRPISGWVRRANIRDTLFSLSQDGSAITDRKFKRTDMATECGGAWKLIPKPPDWRLL